MKRGTTILLVLILGNVLVSRTGFPQLQFQFPDEAFIKSSFWEESVFRDQFLPKEASTQRALKAWTESSEVFGVATHGIWGRFDGDQLTSVTVLFLDSGTHFGYGAKPGTIAEESDRRQKFRDRFQAVEQHVKAGLISLAAKDKSPETVSLGKSPMLYQDVEIYKTGDLFARFHNVEDQLLKVTWFRTLEAAQAWSSPRIASGFPSNVDSTDKNGDVVLKNVPILPQGDRAYCGVSALSMTMLYFGLNAETEDFAAAAGIRFGSTKGSFILEVYDAAADEAGFKLESSNLVDGARIKQSIDMGIPVIVWRRWNQQRDFLHTAFLKKYKQEPEAVLPDPNPEDQATWPGPQDFNHASVLTGYNTKRNEVIFSESWSESVRNRRMRIEELAGTTYYLFYFVPVK